MQFVLDGGAPNTRDPDFWYDVVGRQAVDWWKGIFKYLPMDFDVWADLILLYCTKY